MELLIRLNRRDELEQMEDILASGKGELVGNVLTYTEKNNPNVKHEISFFDESVILKRYGEVTSETDLHTEHRSVARIMSPYGVMMLETELELYKKEANKITVRYRIYQDDEIVTYQTLVWELEGVGI